MAAPRMLSTNEASRRETPCASATPSRTTRAATTRPVTRSWRLLFNGHLELAVAVVSRVVQPLAGGQDAFGIFLFGRRAHLRGGIAHRLGDRRPVRRVLRAPLDLQQLRGLDERSGIARDAAPLAIVLRPRLLDALSRD